MYSKIIKQVFFYSALLVAFLIPFSRKLSVISIVLFIISWLLTGEWFKTFKVAIKNPFFILGISFFLLHVTGLLYSANKHSAWFDLEVKFTLLLFPLIFFLSESLRTNKMQYLLGIFVMGNFLASIICIGNAVYNYYEKDLNTFSYMTLSIFNHPTYFALFICFSIAIILYQFLFSVALMNKLIKYTSIFLILFFAIFIYMLSSKAGIISFFITLVLLSVLALRNKANRITSIIAIFFAGFQLWFSLAQNIRFRTVTSSLATAEQNIQSGESNTARVLVWETTIDILKENYLFGVGTGDIKDVLIKSYKERNMTGAIENKLNVHDQFLETWLGQGIAGITLLLLLFLLPLIISIRNKDWLLLTFIFIVGFNFLFESMLNTQAGVVFFGFFYYYLASLITKSNII